MPTTSSVVLVVPSWLRRCRSPWPPWLRGGPYYVCLRPWASCS